MSTQNIFDLSDTWDDGATTFTSLKINTTDTASAAGSLLMDLQIGGASRFKVAKGGLLSVTPAALSGSAATSSLEIAQTWNTTGTPTALKLDVTDTASNAASLLMDLRVGGSSKFAVSKSGNITIPYNAADTRVFNFGSGANGFRLNAQSGGGVFIERGDAAYLMRISGGGTRIAGLLGIGSVVGGGAQDDTELHRDAADTLAQRRSTNPQTFRLYGTFTDASNSRRLVLNMSAGGVAEIKPDGLGTGASGNVLHISGLPTANPGAGILWNNGGTVEVGT
jgi:hypothetical protein